MKKIIFKFLLLLSFIHLDAQISANTNSSIHELVERWQNNNTTSKSILQDFTYDEIIQLQNYIQIQNSLNVELAGNHFPVGNINPQNFVTNAYGYEDFTPGVVKFNINIPAILTLNGSGDPEEYAGAIHPFASDVAFTVRGEFGDIYYYDIQSGMHYYMGKLNQFIYDMTFNPTNDKLYGISTNQLFEIDPIAATATLIGDLNTSGEALAIAIDGQGNAFVYDQYDIFYTLNLQTGEATAVGYIGFDAAYAQSMNWDPETDTIYLSAFSYETLRGEFRSLDKVTGMTEFIGFIGNSVANMFWVSFVSEEPPYMHQNCDLDGSTSNQSMWNRPLEDGSGMATNGENVYYTAYGPFTVDTTGTYTIQSSQSAWDGMIFLYENEFDPTLPLNNFLAGNDNTGNNNSQITSSLTAGSTYYLITTGTDNSQHGSYTTSISGPGEVSCEEIVSTTCNWTITVSGPSYGHFINWNLKSGNVIIQSGGTYLSNGFEDIRTIDYAGPLDFQIASTQLTELGGSATFTISNGTQIVAMGQIIPGQELNFTGLNCNTAVGCTDAPLGLFPTTAFTPNCGGEEIISNEAKTGQYSIVNLTAEKQYLFSSSVETDFITLTNEDGTQVLGSGTGALNFVSIEAQTVRFYLHLNDNCEYSSTDLRTKSITCDIILGPPANDTCDKAIAVSCGETYEGNTYFSTNTGGNFSNDVYYKFTGNGESQLVNLSLCNSSYDTFVRVFTDCSFTNEIIYNDDACGSKSNVTFYSDGVSTYYILVEGANNHMGEYILEVSCINYAYDNCNPSIFGPTYMGLTLSNAVEDTQIVANDFDVLADTQFEVEKIKLKVITLAGEPTTFDMSFYEGQESVGNHIVTFEGIAPHSITQTENYYNFNTYDVELMLPSPHIFQATADADKKYWVALKAGPTQNNTLVYWSTIVKTIPHSLPTLISEDGGNTWSEYTESVFKLEGNLTVYGECEDLSSNDLNSYQFAYFPNPTIDILTIQSDKKIKSVEVYNTIGQKVLQFNKSVQNQLNLNRLNAGAYIFRVELDGGEIETFKILKK